MKFERGDLVMYSDYGGKREFGIVTSHNQETVHVRYLRTLANSEGTNVSDLVYFNTMEEWLIALEQQDQ